METRDEFVNRAPTSKLLKKGSEESSKTDHAPAADEGVAMPDDVMEEEKWLFELFAGQKAPTPRPVLKKEIWLRVLERLESKKKK